MDLKDKSFLQKHKFIIILALVVVLLIAGGYFVYQEVLNQSNKANAEGEETELAFDTEGPYALMVPRRDGNAVFLNIKRTASYNGISYELAYTSQPEDIKAGSGEDISAGGVDRGVVGQVDTKDRKGEYDQEILFGTCSKNICKYDKGVENGTLTLHITKGDKKFKMITQWHLQRPDIDLGKLTSGDGHFSYTLNLSRKDLVLVGYSIINDLTGVPKLPAGKKVIGKVYSLNIPLAKDLGQGQVVMELADNTSADAKIARYDETKNQWKEYDTKVSGSTLTAQADGSGIFAVLASK